MLVCLCVCVPLRKKERKKERRKEGRRKEDVLNVGVREFMTHSL